MMTAISMVGAIFGGTLIGFLSDRIGRRESMMLSLGLGIAVIPLWAYAPTMALLVTGAFLMQFFVQGAWGVIPAHLTELSPDTIRGFLPGFSYQCGVLLASSVAYMEAIFASHVRFGTAMALVAATVFTGAIIVSALALNAAALSLAQIRQVEN